MNNIFSSLSHLLPTGGTCRQTSLRTVFKLINQFGLYLLILLAGFLNIYNIWNLGYGNSYYAAAIKSMMSSFTNFFFVSFDSTGFISVDKAPLSLWLDTLFAKVFGFNGITILLPHALAGILVTILVYKIVNKISGKLPAFIAGLAITLSPVNVAVYRNNTPDSLLLVFILLTIWFILNYFDQKSFKFLILSALMLGLGFNTKMLQAYLILPAIASAIFLFSPGNFIKRLKVSLVFLAITAVVSFSWITIVDLTPSGLRPFVGGSENNSAWNLALEYNGSQRLFGENGIGGNPGFNVGSKGLNRLFTGEMGTQTGWLLVPVILFSIYFLVKNCPKFFRKFFGKEVFISNYEILTFINILFFITKYLFFSYASFFHSYYLNIFAVPIAFIIGSIFYELSKDNSREKIKLINTNVGLFARLFSWFSDKKKVFLFIILFTALPTQMSLISQAGYAIWLIPLILFVGMIALILLFFQTDKKIAVAGMVILVLSLFCPPFVWSSYTTLSGNITTSIFIGGPNIGSSSGGPGGAGPQVIGQVPPMNAKGKQTPPNNFNGGGGIFDSQSTDSETLNYLKQHYNGEKYFVAVTSQQQATGFILNNNIGNVMTLGGFSGRDKAITLSELQEKIKVNEIRFFLLDGRSGGGFNGNFGGGNPANEDGDGQNQGPIGGGMFNANEDVTSWVKNSCAAIEGYNNLYDCS